MLNPRPVSYLLPLALAWGLAAPAARAANFNVTVQGLTFTPRNLSIQVGDSVTWTNSGGIHNVVADDGSFRCAAGCDGQGGDGTPSGAAWSFSRTFTASGSVPYFCELHGAPGGAGMAGMVTVGGGGGAVGSLQFTAAASSVGEGAGSVTLTVSRTGGDDGAASVTYSTTDGSAQSGSDYSGASGTLSWPDNDDLPRTIVIPILDDPNAEGSETFTVQLSSPTGGAVLGVPSTATVTILDDDAAGSPGALSFTAAAVAVGEGAGNANLSVQRTGGTSGSVSVQWQTANGSASAGSDYLASSGSVSFANGEGGSKSIAVPIVDDTAGESSETFTVQLSAPSGGASLGSPAVATVTINDNDIEPGPCVADSRTLCLNNGRFRVRMRWTDFQSVTRDANAAPETADAGFFYFLDPNNLEVLIKVLNACSPFQRYWVFFAAATNTGYEIRVDDTARGASKSYTNPLGAFPLAVGDTDAFATCP